MSINVRSSKGPQDLVLLMSTNAGRQARLVGGFEAAEAPPGPRRPSASRRKARASHPASSSPTGAAEVRAASARRERPLHAARNAFIVLFLLVQVLLPLRYYVRDDLFDERFAWRMFSPIRVTDCTVGWTEGRDGGEEPLDLDALLPQPWIGLMRRARMDVVEGFGRHRCALLRAEAEAPVLRVDVACSHPDGAVRHPIDPAENLCERIR